MSYLLNVRWHSEMETLYVKVTQTLTLCWHDKEDDQCLLCICKYQEYLSLFKWSHQKKCKLNRPFPFSWADLHQNNIRWSLRQFSMGKILLKYYLMLLLWSDRVLPLLGEDFSSSGNFFYRKSTIGTIAIEANNDTYCLQNE